MSLPLVETPTFVGRVPSSKKTFEFRPFLVKEQKVLLFALETGNLEQIYTAFRDIVSACTRGAVNVDEIPSFDAESVFLQISAKSVGERSDIEVKCSHCQTFNKVSVNLPDVTLKRFKSSGSTIKLTDKIGITFRYPTMRDVIDVSNNSASRRKDNQSPQAQLIYDTVIASIESIFDEKKTYMAQDSSYEELSAFLDTLTIEQVGKIENFFENSPYLSLNVDFKCFHCGGVNSQEIKGIKNFFL